MPKIGEASLTYQIAQLYADDISLSKIGKDKNIHRQQVKREIQKAVKWYLKHFEPIEEGEGEKKLTFQFRPRYRKEAYFERHLSHHFMGEREENYKS